jgi:hypothetical protein
MALKEFRADPALRAITADRITHGAAAGQCRRPAQNFSIRRSRKAAAAKRTLTEPARVA